MNTEPGSETDSFDVKLKTQAHLLVENLEEGNVSRAVQALFSLNDARNDSLYSQIGRITRGLHDAISKLEFANDGKDSESRDVQARVGYVIDLTNIAANRTMDLADAATPIAEELGQESRRLRNDWRRLKNRELDAAEFRSLYVRIDDFLAFAEDKSAKLHTTMMDIVVAQGYQDLSGQILHKIVNMLNTTEADLIKLLAMAGRIQEVSGITDEPSVNREPARKDIEAEGPLPDSKTTLKDQSEVDDLLSSLGF